MSSIHITADRPYESARFEENKLILLWSMTVWLVVMNTTMFNVALPNVLIDLSITSSTASWIVSGYSIVFAISTLTYSRLSDFIPIERLLIIGLSLLGVSSIIGFFAHEFYLLLLTRVLQASGAGAVPGLAMVLAGRYIPLSRRGRAMSYIASAASLGFGLGPVIGGAIVQYLGWNYLFIVTGLVVFFIPIFKKLLPKEEMGNGKFDTVGGLLTGLGVTGLLLFLTNLSPLYAIISIVLIILLWKHVNRVELPFIQPSLLKNRQYVKLLMIGFSVFITHFSTLFLMPIILASYYQKEAAAIGMIIFPGAILSAIAAQFIGRLIDRFGNIPITVAGQIFLLISTIMFTAFSSVSEYFILVAYMFMSTGFSALTSSIGNEATRILRDSQIGSGMGMLQLTQFFGGSFGVAITGVSLTLQSVLGPEQAYRAIFLGMCLLVIFSVVIFSQYVKKAFSLKKDFSN